MGVNALMKRPAAEVRSLLSPVVAGDAEWDAPSAIEEIACPESRQLGNTCDVFEIEDDSVVICHDPVGARGRAGVVSGFLSPDVMSPPADGWEIPQDCD